MFRMATVRHQAQMACLNNDAVISGGQLNRPPAFASGSSTEARIRGVIQIGPAEATARPSDRTITAIAEDGIYRPWNRRNSRAAFPVATMRAMSMPMFVGWRHCAAPGSSSASTPTNGASPMIWLAEPPTTMPAETGRPVFASCHPSIWKGRYIRTARRGWTGD